MTLSVVAVLGPGWPWSSVDGVAEIWEVPPVDEDAAPWLLGDSPENVNVDLLAESISGEGS